MEWNGPKRGPVSRSMRVIEFNLKANDAIIRVTVWNRPLVAFPNGREYPRGRVFAFYRGYR